jgi:hypothetical protein
MTSQTGALLTTGGSALVGMREDLNDVVSRMDPGTTPMVSWFGTGTAKNDLSHDWQEVDLRAPRRSPANEANVTTNSTAKRSTRLSNVCEIFYERYGVSGTSMAVDTAGGTGDLDFQRLLKGLELRTDLEVAVLGPQAKSTTDPRSMGGVQAYAVYYDIGTGTVPTGDGATEVVYDASSQTLNTTLLDDVRQQGFPKGANYSLMVMSSAQKRAFDLAIPVESLADAQIDVTNTDGVVVSTTVAVWKSTFGNTKFIMDPVLDKYTASWAERCILMFDERSEYRPKICTLPGRGWQVNPIARVGDVQEEDILYEGTLEVPNRASIALCGALGETYAS